MKKRIRIWQLVGFAVTSLFGTLLHFLYEWTGNSVFVASFSSVNESTFEYMKLLFFPMLIFAIVQSFFFRWRDDFWWVKLKGILLGLALIPVLFYTYNGVIGRSPDFVNIAIFLISAAAAYIYETRLLLSRKKASLNPAIAVSLIFAISLLFVTFTFSTPNINIFRDPLRGQIGM